MQGNLHLVGLGVNHSAGMLQQCAVGGYYRNESLLAGFCNELRQMPVQQRFAHEVKIEELDLPLQAVGEQIEFGGSKGMFCPFGLWAKKAIEIAYVGYLKIAACYHGTPLH